MAELGVSRSSNSRVANDSFQKLVSFSTSELTLGRFESSWSSAERALSAALAPQHRAQAAVVAIQALQELGRTPDALKLARDAFETGNFHLSHDLVIVVTSLALYIGDLVFAEGVASKWFLERLASIERGDSQPSARDAEVMRLYILRVVVDLRGPSESISVLERAKPILEESEYGKIRADLDSLLESSTTYGNGVLVPAPSLGVPRNSRVNSFATRMQSVVLQLGGWLRARGGTERRAIVVVALFAVWVLSLLRKRSQLRKSLRAMPSAIVEIFKLGFLRGRGR